MNAETISNAAPISARTRTQARVRRTAGAKRRPARLSRTLARNVLSAAERVSPGLAAWLLYQMARHPPKRRVDPGTEEVLARARHGVVRFNTHNLRTYTWGEQGPTVLCVHGWGGLAAQMTPFVAPLREAGYRVVAFDAPAHGATGGGGSDPMEFMRSICAVARSIGPIHAVISHSLGAATTLLATRDGTLRPSRLVLLSGYSSLDLVLDQMRGMFRVSVPVLKRTWERLCGVYGTRSDDENMSPLAALRELDCATLILHDEDDAIVPISHSEELLAAARSGEIVRTRGLGHHSILNSEIARRCADFISR